MEVSGQKRQNNCKTCEENEVSTYSDGVCSECGEEMCRSCFDSHNYWKVNEEHQLVNSDVATSQHKRTPASKFDLCEKHSEAIKFFCPQHDAVGCSDCIIINHKVCKVEYIFDRIDGFVDSKVFKQLQFDIEESGLEAQTILQSIEIDRNRLTVDIRKFVADVNLFKDEMVEQITKLTNVMLNAGETYMKLAMENLDSLERENENIITQTTDMKETLELQADKPYKLFISTMSYKENIQLIKDQLANITEKNKVETYEFRRNCNLEQLIIGCKKIGTIIKVNIPKSVKEHLTERQLICNNLNLGRHLMSHNWEKVDDLGLFVDKKKLDIGDMFEIEVLQTCKGDSIALGVLPDGYPSNTPPGLKRNSIGYHSDGNVYCNSGSGTKHEPWQVGDRIGCLINCTEGVHCLYTIFTHNDKKIDGGILPWLKTYHFAIGMKCSEDRIKVTKLPEY